MLTTKSKGINSLSKRKVSVVMKEIWRDIKGYEGYYQISNLGNVKSLERSVVKSDGVVQIRKERIMDKRFTIDGYVAAKLNVNKVSKCIAVHILVARHFIPNPNNYPEVNHKDCNRQNNIVENLEWCTHQQNIEHSKKLGHYKGRSGKDNYNYGNHKLHNFYQEHPELCKTNQSRPREQNGRCIPVEMIKDSEIHTFRFIGEAVEYLINNKYTNCKARTIYNHIKLAIKENSPYLGFYFQKINKIENNN